MKKPQESSRSPKWRTLRRAFLVGKSCSACGSKKKLEAHHIKPFHKYPQDELKRKNLQPLCEGNPDMNCHLMIGHSGDFKGYNPHSVRDAVLMLSRIQANRKRIHG